MRLVWIPVALMFGCTGGDTPDDPDADGDGVPASLDCDDSDSDRAPGRPERCDGKDNDCNNLVDDNAADAPPWYRDIDEDGYGNPDISVRACASPGEGFVDNDDDCNDLFDTSYPGADEVCDGNDNDCDEEIDEDAIDAQEWYRDRDDDKFGDDSDTASACSPPVGYVAGPGDCDDEDPDQNPRADEVCNGEDDDCDEGIDEDAVDAPEQYVDADRDGHGTPEGELIRACEPPDGYASLSDDCDDTEPTVFPGSTEVCDGLDNDCNPSTSEDGLVSVGGTNVSDLASGVSSAVAGDTVSVCPGAFAAALTIDKDLVLDGPQGADLTILSPSTADTPILTIEGGAIVTVSGLAFQDGDAPAGGAIDAQDGGDLGIRDCAFTGNIAVDGGAVIANTSATTTVTTSTFSGNVATGKGGALYVGEVTLETSTLSGNLAQDGGAIYITGGSGNMDTDTLIEKNEATRDGGGVAVDGANGISGGTISENEAGANGGGVWVDDGGTVTSIELDSNVADGDGGGIYAAGDAMIETLFLFDNTATRGGGIGTNGDVDVSACELDGNVALDEGGGIAVLSAGDVAVTGGILTGNSATTGGGAWVGDGTLTSSASDWGTSSLDNSPDDVAVSGGDTYDSYGAAASFTCTASDGTCS